MSTAEIAEGRPLAHTFCAQSYDLDGNLENVAYTAGGTRGASQISATSHAPSFRHQSTASHDPSVVGNTQAWSVTFSGFLHVPGVA